jgi:hypothetical protein
MRLRLFLEAFGLRLALLSPDQPLNSRSHVLASFNKGLFDFLIAIGAALFGGSRRFCRAVGLAGLGFFRGGRAPAMQAQAPQGGRHAVSV